MSDPCVPKSVACPLTVENVARKSNKRQLAQHCLAGFVADKNFGYDREIAGKAA
jgi:hypothetical protein